MDLSLTADQQSLSELFAKIFSTESTPARIRAAEPLGWDAELWRVLVSSGVPGMGVAEELGGGGACAADLVVVAMEYGRYLASVPLLEVLAVTHLLADLPDAHDLLAGILDGTVVPTLAVRPATGPIATLVPAAAIADLVVVFDGEELVAITRGGTRPHQPSPANLAASPIADVAIDWDGSTRRVLARGPAAKRGFDRAVTRWQLLTAAALVGLQQQALKLGADYVKVREAFGVQLGWFQSVQHRLADVTTAGESAELLMQKAAWATDSDNPAAEALTIMAFLATSDAAFQTCRATLQFHGGYGFTLEYDIQLYFRRAKGWPLLLGPTRDQYRRLARVLYLREADNASNNLVVA
jgi:alkylation response protein AidB-like acyl-CoA dehydrogenase